MKRLFTVLVTILFTIVIFGQAPQKMSYQAVVRNASGVLVQSISVGMRISILQGSVSGTAVYSETQTPTTNTNGLVTIEIGGGTPVTGTFAGIDWSSGPYFIKTETDPTGGTDYTITGTAQLLSVPYSLHAKTAESISGTITETDPVYSGSQAANITSNDITKLNNLSGTNTGDQDLSGLASTTALTTGLADKVDKVTGKGLSTNDYTTVEQTKLAGIATDAEVNVNADWNAVTGDAQVLNKPTIPTAADGSETKITAGTNVTVTGTGTTASPYVVNATATHYSGELYGGGVVFWVDQTGNHGLICSMIDHSTSKAWSDVTSTAVPAPGASSDWDGPANTTAIVAQSIATSAADLCDAYTNTDYGTGVYSDWYLPSRSELSKIWTYFYQVQKALDSDGNSGTTAFTRSYYWSSVEYNPSLAWSFNFYNVGDNNTGPKTTENSVRSVRAF